VPPQSVGTLCASKVAMAKVAASAPHRTRDPRLAEGAFVRHGKSTYGAGAIAQCNARVVAGQPSAPMPPSVRGGTPGRLYCVFRVPARNSAAGKGILGPVARRAFSNACEFQTVQVRLSSALKCGSGPMSGHSPSIIVGKCGPYAVRRARYACFGGNVGT